MNSGNDIEKMSLQNSAGYKNLMAIRDYSKMTREEVNRIEEEFKHLRNLVLQQKKEIDQLRNQIAILLQKII